MKKLTLLGLSLTFLLSALTACGTTTETTPSTGNDTPSVSQPSTQPATPPEDDGVVGDMSLTEDNGVADLAEPPMDGEGALPDDMEEFVGNEFSMALAASIVAGRDEESNMYVPVMTSTQDPMAEFIFPLMGLSFDDVESFGIAVSAMNVQAYGVAAILPADGQEEVVMAGLQGFIDTQIQSFTNYLADQLEIAEAARLETLEDGTILMVMCENQDDVFDAIATHHATTHTPTTLPS